MQFISHKEKKKQRKFDNNNETVIQFKLFKSAIEITTVPNLSDKVRSVMRARHRKRKQESNTIVDNSPFTIHHIIKSKSIRFNLKINF